MRPWHVVFGIFLILLSAPLPVPAEAESLLFECVAKTPEGQVAETMEAQSTCTVPSGSFSKVILDTNFDDGGDVFLNGTKIYGIPGDFGVDQDRKEIDPSLVPPGSIINLRVVAKNAVGTVYGRASIEMYGTVGASSLTGTCSPTKVTLSWTPVENAVSNAIQKGYEHPDGSYWEWFLTSDTPPFDVYYAEDTNLQPNTVYEYRVKTDAQVASNIFRCDTTVVAPPPPPPPPSAPTADLKVDGSDSAQTVSKDSTVSLSWTSANAASCTVAPGNLNGTSGTQVQVRISKSTEFVLSCSGAGGGATDRVRVNVAADSPPPPIDRPSVDLRINDSDGPLTVKKGEDLEIRWVSRAANNCTVTPDGFQALSGLERIKAPAERTDFVIFCMGQGGTASDRVIVDISAPTAPAGRAPTVATLAPSEFGLSYMTVNGYANPNGAATTAWFEYGPTQTLNRVTGSRSIGSGRSAASLSAEIPTEIGQEYFYRMVARNAYGVSRGPIRRAVASSNAFFVIEPTFKNIHISERVQFRSWYDPDGSGPEKRRDVTADTVWISSDTSVAYHDRNAAFLGKGSGKTEVWGIFSPDGPVRNVNDIGNLRAESVIVIDEGLRDPMDVSLTTSGSTNTQGTPSEQRSSLMRNALWGFLVVVVIAATILGIVLFQKRRSY